MTRKSYDYYYTRQYHVKLTLKQIETYYRAIGTQNKLYQYALHYMYKTFGYKHVDRPLPSQIKVEKGQKQDRWNSVNYLI